MYCAFCNNGFVSLLLYTCGRKRLELPRGKVWSVINSWRRRRLQLGVVGRYERLFKSFQALLPWKIFEYGENRSTLYQEWQSVEHEYAFCCAFLFSDSKAIKLVKFGEIGGFTVRFQDCNEAYSSLKTALHGNEV